MPRKAEPLARTKRRAARKAKALPRFKQKRAAGRPMVYEAEAHCARAYKLALLGLTDAEIAEQFGVDVSTFNRWKAQHPELKEALNDGKTPFDAEVAAAMGKRALGYEHPAVKIFMPQGAKEPVYAPYMEHIPGDVGAQKSWLFNRQGMRWKDRQQVEVGGTIEHRLLAMTPEERTVEAIAFAAKMRQAIAEARKTIDGEAKEVEKG